MLGAVLPRRSYEHLPRASWLHVESHRIAAQGVRALQIAEFHQLMPHKTWIAIRDDQMPFAFLDVESWREMGRVCANRIHNHLAADLRVVLQPDSSLPDLRYPHAEAKLRSALLRAANQKLRRTRRIQHTIFRNQQPSQKSYTKIWLQTLQRARIEHFRGNSALAVIVPFAPHLKHFFFVGCDPDRSALFVFDVIWQLWS